MSEHVFEAKVVWGGNLGEGTATYASYGRRFRGEIAGKPVLEGSAAPTFRGDADRHNPEDLFLLAISACHMLFYLSLCARSGVRVVAYEDVPTGRLAVDSSGGGRFEEVTLRPIVTIEGDSKERARDLHHDAHVRCFIANSCSVPIRHDATIRIVRQTA